MLEALVELREARNILVLMVENLDDLLSGHHLLNVAVGSTQILLLLQEILSGDLSHIGEDHEQHQYHKDGDERQRNVQNEHADQGHDDRKARVDDLRNTLGVELPQRINVVGIDRHDITVGVLIKVLQRQVLHVGEDLFAEALHGTLTDIHHKPLVYKVAHNAQCKDQSHFPNHAGKRSIVRVNLVGERDNVVVHEITHDHDADYRGKCRDNDTKHHHGKGEPIPLQHVTHGPFKDLARVFDAGHSPRPPRRPGVSLILFCHLFRLLSWVRRNLRRP